MATQSALQFFLYTHIHTGKHFFLRGAICGSVSCPRTLRHADGDDRDRTAVLLVRGHLNISFKLCVCMCACTVQFDTLGLCVCVCVWAYTRFAVPMGLTDDVWQVCGVSPLVGTRWGWKMPLSFYILQHIFFTPPPLPPRSVAYDHSYRLAVIDWQFDFETT